MMDGGWFASSQSSAFPFWEMRQLLNMENARHLSRQFTSIFMSNYLHVYPHIPPIPVLNAPSQTRQRACNYVEETGVMDQILMVNIRKSYLFR
jgi:hypothetical protein